MTIKIKILIAALTVVILAGVLTTVLVLNSKNDYVQNKNPDYTTFAYDLGGMWNESDFSVQMAMPVTRKLGNAICDALRQGKTEEEVTDALEGSGTEGYTLDRVQAASLVNSAHENICSGR